MTFVKYKDLWPPYKTRVSDTMKTMHKYAINLTENTEVELPSGSEIRTIKYLTNDKKLFMWAEVTTEINIQREKRKFKVFKTGDGIPETAVFIGTAVDQYIPESYHVFELL